MKFTTKKLVSGFLCICIAAIFLSACSGSKADKEAADAVTNKIAQMSEEGFPTLSDAKALDIEYNNLTSQQKDLVGNYGILQNFLSMDLDAMAIVQNGINSLGNVENASYGDLMAIQEKYEALASDEQALITGGEWAAVQHVRFATYRKSIRAIRCLRTSQLPVLGLEEHR